MRATNAVCAPIQAPDFENSVPKSTRYGFSLPTPIVEYLTAGRLNAEQTVLAGLLTSLTRNDRVCNAGWPYLAARLNCSPRTAQRNFAALKHCGLFNRFNVITGNRVVGGHIRRSPKLKALLAADPGFSENTDYLPPAPVAIPDPGTIADDEQEDVIRADETVISPENVTNDTPDKNDRQSIEKKIKELPDAIAPETLPLSDDMAEQQTALTEPLNPSDSVVNETPQVDQSAASGDDNTEAADNADESPALSLVDNQQRPRAKRPPVGPLPADWQPPVMLTNHYRRMYGSGDPESTEFFIQTTINNFREDWTLRNEQGIFPAIGYDRMAAGYFANAWTHERRQRAIQAAQMKQAQACASKYEAAAAIKNAEAEKMHADAKKILAGIDDEPMTLEQKLTDRSWTEKYNFNFDD